MSKYPENFDDNQSLPSPYGKNTTYSSRYTCKVNNGATGILVDADTLNPLLMEENTRYLITLNCGIVRDNDSSIFANYNAVVYAYYDCISVEVTEVINTLSPLNYQINISNSGNSLLFEVVNNSAYKVTASASVQYIKI